MEWLPTAIMVIYLLGIAYRIYATWDDPGGWGYDLGHTVGAVLWPIPFVCGFLWQGGREIRRCFRLGFKQGRKR